MNSETHRAKGKILGYPTCCIEEFLHLEAYEGATRKFWGTGFVPCAACNETKTEAQLISEINSVRQVSLPFPTTLRQDRKLIDEIDQILGGNNGSRMESYSQS